MIEAMSNNPRTDEDAKDEALLGLASVVLFAALLVALAAGTVTDWRGPWELIWNVIGGGFGLVLLAYLRYGGLDTVLGRKGSHRSRRWGPAELIALLGLAFLSLTFVGNFIAAIQDDHTSHTLSLVRDIAAACFALCFILYIIFRYGRRRRT